MRQQRKKLGLTQAQTAEIAGLSRSCYSKIERGQRGLSLIQMYQIARALQIDFDASFFLDDSDEVPQIKQLKGGK